MNMDMSVSSNESVNRTETWTLKNWEEKKKKKKKTHSALGFKISILGELWDKQFNCYGLTPNNLKWYQNRAQIQFVFIPTLFIM